MEKIALVTGGHRGLGLGWSTFLAEQGCQVIIAGRSPQRNQAAVDKITGLGGKAFSAELDVSSEESILKLAARVESEFGHVDLLINNAGVNPKDFSDKARSKAGFYLDFLDPEVLIDVYRVNSIGPILMVKHFKSLLESGSEKMVVNISSWLSSVSNLGFGGHYGYVSSKNLLNVLNKSMALEIKDSGIVCVNVNPGWVKTDMGGKKAQFTPSEAVNQVFSNVIKKVKLADTGKFYNYDGTIHPW